MEKPPDLVIVEPYCSGSHAQLVDFLRSTAPAGSTVLALTLPGKKWHWRLQGSSIWASQGIPALAPSSTLLVSSMCNLCELLGLRPDLASSRVVLYMHENQLAYPWRGAESGSSSSSSAPVAMGAAASTSHTDAVREFHAGWAQLTSMLAAKVIAWNSLYNLDSFAAALPGFLRGMPDKAHRPCAATLAAQIYSRSVVLHCPVARPLPAAATSAAPTAPPPSRLRVCWPHRWEHDKNPEALFQALLAPGITCELVLLGEAYAAAPPVFAASQAALQAAGRAAHWGYAASRSDYAALLASCDLVLSTAHHEFFGVAVVEGVLAGCFPLCPHALAYPEVLTPSARVAAAVASTPERVAELLGSGGSGGSGSASAAWQPPAHIKFSGQGSGDAAAAGVGGGGGSKKRQHSEEGSAGGQFFYSGSAGSLALALAECQANLGALREWRAALKGALAGSEGGGGGGEGASAGSGRFSRGSALALARVVTAYTPEEAALHAGWKELLLKQ